MQSKFELSDFLTFEKTGEWDEDRGGDMYRVMLLGVEVDKVYEPFQTCENQRLEERAQDVVRAIWNMPRPGE